MKKKQLLECLTFYNKIAYNINDNLDDAKMLCKYTNKECVCDCIFNTICFNNICDSLEFIIDYIIVELERG